jgi:hypothetical protein
LYCLSFGFDNNYYDYASFSSCSGLFFSPLFSFSFSFSSFLFLSFSFSFPFLSFSFLFLFFSFFSLSTLFFVSSPSSYTKLNHFTTQPALLYLVPYCLGSSLIVAAVKGQLKELFSYEEKTPEVKKE